MSGYIGEGEFGQNTSGGFPDVSDLFRMGVHESLLTTDFDAGFEAFFGLFADAAPKLAKRLDPEARRGFLWPIFRAIWNHTPRPDMGWKRLTEPKPERNTPCPCGSGLKYKQCCATLNMPDVFGGEGFSVLQYVFETIPVRSYATLPFANLDPTEVAHVAREWLDEDRVESATLLLEGLLRPEAKLDARHVEAFDVLCNIYLDDGRSDDREALVVRLMQSQDKFLRAAAYQRKATMCSDQGDKTEAWAAFKEAQRLDPDNPSLSHLEIVLLAGQGRTEEVKARAEFWALRLTKLGYGNDPIVELMRQVAQNPDYLGQMLSKQGIHGIFDVSFEDVQALAALVDKLPSPISLYTLTPIQDSEGNETAGPLVSTKKLRDITKEWWDLYYDEEENICNIWYDPSWLEWIAENPKAWMSFEILEAIVETFSEPFFDEASHDLLDKIEQKLLSHAVELLKLVIAKNGTEDLGLEWGWLENRSALRLLMWHIDQFSGADELSLLEWLVLRLNPSDNSGHRGRLLHAYCLAGRASDALALCERYPDDHMAEMLYGKVLAKYVSGDISGAAKALAYAGKERPKVLRTLIATRPKEPDLRQGLISLGGDDEAWYYRINCRVAWVKCGGLDWLKAQAKVGNSRRLL